jgi:hypothetical protein
MLFSRTILAAVSLLGAVSAAPVPFRELRMSMVANLQASSSMLARPEPTFPPRTM